jgi:hypothetical protein
MFAQITFVQDKMECIIACLQTVLLYSFSGIVGFITVPFIHSYLNNYTNNLLLTEQDDIFKCIMFKLLFDYISFFVTNKVIFVQTRTMEISFLQRLNMAKIYCAVPLP